MVNNDAQVFEGRILHDGMIVNFCEVEAGERSLENSETHTLLILIYFKSCHIVGFYHAKSLDSAIRSLLRIAKSHLSFPRLIVPYSQVLFYIDYSENNSEDFLAVLNLTWHLEGLLYLLPTNSSLFVFTD